VLKKKINALLKEYYRLTSAEIHVSVYENNSNDKTHTLYWYIKNIYPIIGVHKKLNPALFVTSTYNIETIVTLKLYIDLEKLKELNQDHKQSDYSDFLVETITKDVRNAFGIDKNIKERLSFDSIVNLSREGEELIPVGRRITFDITKNHRVVVWLELPKTSIALRRHINITIERNKTCNLLF